MKNRYRIFFQPLIITGLFLILNWSCNKENPPTLITLPAFEITGNNAKSGGDIIDNGGASVTSRGVVWSTLKDPTINNNLGSTSDGSGDGQFVSTLKGLTPGTIYYIRAYASNSAGTAYGNQEQFITVELASVTTSELTDITSRTATSGGNVMDDGGAEVTARGIVWSTSESPDVDNNEGITLDSSGPGQFTSELTKLNPGTSYYVRAYATNLEGTSYGEQVEFLTETELATVTSDEVTIIRVTSAISGGIVLEDGGTEVTARGVVWSTSESPDVDNNEGITLDGSGPGQFTSELTDLSPETKYYTRAYAINSVGNSYGDQKVFETPGPNGEPCPGIAVFIDERDGTVYNTVLIGSQCWMKENLKYIPEVSPGSAGSQTEPHYYVYDHIGTDISVAIATDNYQNYGVLYNWPAAMNGEESSSANPGVVQGVCPAGWHLPSDAEWAEMIDYVISQGYPYEWNNPNGTGNALKSCRQVDSPLGGECATSDHPRWNSHSIHSGFDEYGFSALPGGYRHYFGTFNDVGRYGSWWSSTELSSAYAWYRRMGSVDAGVGRYYNFEKDGGFSVRCVRDVD